MVQDEVVEDDHAGAATQRLDDPAVSLGVVTDVVQRDVAPRGATEASGPGEGHLDPLCERREQKRRVVGDPGAGRRQGRVVGDPQARDPRATLAAAVAASTSCLFETSAASASSSAAA